ncbi:hypothetical protein [Enterococcus faecium]|uniref:hypothetical protein n=1 Tax=Enterococcus faecium TaxID=1352 RepID=UPI0013893B19|nr:hypothetical protein [Enterococcus faecium]NDK21530.1 hypothetical protein [Enterococcus faecium]NDK47015.1 hypothetical protein [Enterococcus faecium]HAT7584633.1 hypothetical protein [Enterococcus faecium]
MLLISKLKTFIKERPQTALIRSVLIAVAIAIIVNFLSDGQLYKSGLFLVLLLVVLDVVKSKRK